MDIFKQKRYLSYAVLALLLMNITILVLLWVGRPGGPKPQRALKNPVEDNGRLQQLLKKELGFDETQSKRYLTLRQEHREQTRRLEDEIRKLRSGMFDEVLKDNPQPMLSDSLLKLVQEKEAMREQLTFQHFLDLKNLCGPEQQNKLKLLMREALRQNPPPGMEAGGPPPPRRGDGQHPPRPSRGDRPPPESGDRQPPKHGDRQPHPPPEHE
ncbi:MAG: hypothetical protein DWQ10_03880 [Calditrichaeota bacterium]|nr:MAG: hypothetical protein DWQ10_03880 [Calditrichota bacterium]